MFELLAQATPDLGAEAKLIGGLIASLGLTGCLTVAVLALWSKLGQKDEQIEKLRLESKADNKAAADKIDAFVAARDRDQQELIRALSSSSGSKEALHG